jgi:hypothetical protein
LFLALAFFLSISGEEIWDHGCVQWLYLLEKFVDLQTLLRRDVALLLA